MGFPFDVSLIPAIIRTRACQCRPWFEFGKVGTCRLALRPGLLTGPCVRATLFWSWQPDYRRPPGNSTVIFTGRRGPSEEPRIKSPLVLNLFSLSFFSYLCGFWLLVSLLSGRH
jgi:hypothetical protein